MPSRQVVILPDEDFVRVCESTRADACASYTNVIYIKDKIVHTYSEATLNEVLKHELVHEWIHWKGLKDNDEHGDIFKKKATEIGLNDRRYNTILAAQPINAQQPDQPVETQVQKPSGEGADWFVPLFVGFALSLSLGVPFLVEKSVISRNRLVTQQVPFQHAIKKSRTVAARRTGRSIVPSSRPVSRFQTQFKFNPKSPKPFRSIF